MYVNYLGREKRKIYNRERVKSAFHMRCMPFPNKGSKYWGRNPVSLKFDLYSLRGRKVRFFAIVQSPLSSFNSHTQSTWNILFLFFQRVSPILKLLFTSLFFPPKFFLYFPGEDGALLHSKKGLFKHFSFNQLLVIGLSGLSPFL